MTALPQKSAQTLRILHTADWHIGKQLADESRYDDFADFLAWLADCITSNEVDLLIVAGDIFDTMTPSHTAQQLYYQFLGKINNSTCKNVVIVAGNHDSPTLLNAPKELFRHFNIFVIGEKQKNPNDEIININSNNGKTIAKICAVPYLRERDVRTEHFGSNEDRNQSMLDGIARHYAELLALCQANNPDNAPIIATGHLFSAGAMVSATDDGMRKLYAGETAVGTLGCVSPSIFAGFDYVALGHIHREQAVGGQSHIRYSGSPMAFCFDEINQDKKVLIIDFNEKIPTITPITLPIFRTLVDLTGDWQTVKQSLKTLINTPHTSPKKIWLSVRCKNAPADLKNEINTIIDGFPIQLLIWKKDEKVITNHRQFNAKSLTELTPNDVFQTLLTSQKTAEKKSVILDENSEKQLTDLYQQIIFELENDDKMAV